jgi:hypothetical protein
MDASAVEFHLNESGQVRVLQPRDSSRLRAARLLDAWVSGDRRRLTRELSDLAAPGSGCEGGETNDGREELLLCVVRQMRSEPDLYASRAEKLHLGVWLDLLAHLSAES